MYQALYRKYRPLFFSDMVGQEHITTTLKNEVNENKTGHAYLFIGTRGTGKTSCAKILAKAVNCLNPTNGDPCNNCDICIGINNGSILDVIEIDGASYNKVDDIRELREEVVYVPTQTKKKVYIIDEVHMLSTPAFNALLKTLEEPPPHIIFIFATTEIYKVLPTIISRCQRFDFKRIPISLIVQRLEKVCDKEKIEYDKDALSIIARFADGSMRDGLSLLDKCAGVGKKVSIEQVLNSTGSSGKDNALNIIKSIAECNINDCLNEVAYLYSNSKDMSRLCEELLSIFRDIIINKTVTNPKEILEYTQKEIDQLTGISNSFKLERVLYCINTISDTINIMPRSANKRVEVEIALIRLCDSKLSDSNNAILSRLVELEAKIKSGAFTKSQVKNQEIIPTTIENPKPKSKEKTQIQTNSPQINADFWAEVLESIKALNIMHWSLLKSSNAKTGDNNLYIYTENSVANDTFNNETEKNVIAQAVFNITGEKYIIKFNMINQKEEKADDFDLFLYENSDKIEMI